MFKKFLLLLSLIVSVSAFTVRPAATQGRVAAPSAPAVKPLPMFIDPNIPEIASQPTGSIIMLVLTVSLWELAAKREVKK